MFFILSKTIGTLLIPPNLLVACGMIGISLLVTRYASMGRALVVCSFLGLAICGISPLGSVLLLELEDRFPPWKPTQDAPAGIVVLGGAIDPDISAGRDAAVADIGIDRVIKAVQLAHRYPQARIIYSSGSANLVGSDAREADYAFQTFNSLGIPPDRVTIERNSRNTVENAVYSKVLADPKPGERWLLVTSAYHMPRSIGIFRKVGFPVIPVPVGWRTVGPGDRFRFSTFFFGIAQLNLAAHEWIGLLAYWIAGKTTELFPGPD